MRCVGFCWMPGSLSQSQNYLCDDMKSDPSVSLSLSICLFVKAWDTTGDGSASLNYLKCCIFILQMRSHGNIYVKMHQLLSNSISVCFKSLEGPTHVKTQQATGDAPVFKGKLHSNWSHYSSDHLRLQCRIRMYFCLEVISKKGFTKIKWKKRSRLERWRREKQKGKVLQVKVILGRSKAVGLFVPRWWPQRPALMMSLWWTVHSRPLAE